MYLNLIEKKLKEKIKKDTRKKYIYILDAVGDGDGFEGILSWALYQKSDEILTDKANSYLEVFH
jgi:hypothetical protein